MITAKYRESDLKRLFKKLKSLNPKDRGASIFKGMTQANIFMEGQLKRACQRGILKGDGVLAKSISSKIINTVSGITGIIGSGVRSGKRLPYANIHETGGTIKAKNVKFLTIPIPGKRFLKGKRARDFKNTFVRKRMIFQKYGKGIRALFILKKQVKIPARHYMSITLRNNLNRSMNIMIKSINAGLNK